MQRTDGYTLCGGSSPPRHVPKGMILKVKTNYFRVRSQEDIELFVGKATVLYYKSRNVNEIYTHYTYFNSRAQPFTRRHGSEVPVKIVSFDVRRCIENACSRGRWRDEWSPGH